MDKMLIRLWNEVVGADDIVYHLGDFTLGGLSKFKAITCQLNGKLRILPGSHDHGWLKNYDDSVCTAHGHLVELLPPLVSLEVPGLNTGRHSQVIVLCHYAMRVWDRSHYGSWHLHGHSHGKLPRYERSYDVGVDSNVYRPVNLERVAQIIVDWEKALNK
jgi:calcineurin-like phosphoesterase family protein